MICVKYLCHPYLCAIRIHLIDFRISLIALAVSEALLELAESIYKCKYCMQLLVAQTKPSAHGKTLNV